MNIIFYIGNMRSATTFLTSLFKINGVDICSKHEPEPDMFGRPIYWNAINKSSLIEERFLKKKRKIENCKKKNYIEFNHAFLKSFAHIAIEHYPDLKLVRSIRNPLELAKSALNKKKISKLLPGIYTYYKEDKRYWRWMFTGKEGVFKNIDFEKLTVFEYYILEWFEVEYRASEFLKNHNKNCFTIYAPTDLNNEEKLRSMFLYLGIDLKYEKLLFPKQKNRNFIKTRITEKELQVFYKLLHKIPETYLNILTDDIYKNCEWISLFQRSLY